MESNRRRASRGNELQLQFIFDGITTADTAFPGPFRDHLRLLIESLPHQLPGQLICHFTALVL